MYFLISCIPSLWHDLSLLYLCVAPSSVGLKFDENGMPIMPNMGSGMMPGGAAGQFPNMAELANSMSQGTCTIM